MDLSKIHCLSIRYEKIANGVACSVTLLSPASLITEGEKQSQITCIGIDEWNRRMAVQNKYKRK